MAGYDDFTSEKYFRLLFDKMSDAAFLADVESGLLFDANLSAVKLTGRARSELVGKHQSILHTDKNEGKRIFRAAMLEGAPHEFESSVITKKGNIVPVLITVTIIKLDGRTFALGIFKDITEIKHVETELLKEREWSNSIIHSAPNIIIGLGKNSKILIFNEFAEKLTGYKAKEVIGSNWIDIFISKDKRREMYKLWENIVDKKLVGHHYTNPIILKDKSERLISWNNTCLTEHDKFKMVLSIGEDVTEREKLLIQLRQSEYKYRKIFDNSPEIIILLDNFGKVLDINYSVFNAIGYKPSEVIGKLFFKLPFIPKKSMVAMRENFIKRVKGEDVGSYTADFIAKNGLTHYGQVNGSVVKDDNGRIIRSLITIRDITEIKNAETELVESEQKLYSIINGSLTPTFVIGTNHKILYWNSALEKLSGLTARKMIGTNNQWVVFYNKKRPVMSDLLVNGDFKAVHSWYANKVSKSSLLANAYEAIDFFPKLKKWLRFGAVPIKDSKGKLIGAIETLEDITAKKKFEELLINSESRFKALFNNMKSGVSVYEAVNNGNDFIFKDFNKAAERIDKISKASVIGRSILKVFPGVRKFGLFDIFKQVYRTGVPKHHPISLYKDKRLNSWRENYVYKLPTGEIVAVFDDVTEQKKANIALTFSEVRYRRLFEAARDGIFILDYETGKIVDVNPYMTEMLGFTHNELIGEKLWDLGYFKDIIASRAAFKILQKKGYIHYENLPLKTKKGIIFTVEFVSNVYDVGGRKVIQCNIRDITGRKKAEEKIVSLARFPNENPNPVMRFSKTDLLFANKPGLDFFKKYVAFCKNRKDTLRNLIIESLKNNIRKDAEINLGENYYLLFFIPFVNENYVNVYAINITTRRKAEGLLQDSESRFRELFSSMGNGVAVYEAVNDGADFIFKDLNKAGERISKIRRSKAVGQRLTKLFPSIKKSGLLEMFTRVFKTGKSERIPAVLYNDKNLNQWVDNYVYKLPTGELIVVYDDITVRKKIEDELKDSEEKFRTLIENASDQIFIIDNKYRFVSANKVVLTLFRKTPNEVIGKHISEIFPKEIAAKNLENLKHIFKTGKGIFIEEKLNIGGHEFWASSSLNPVKNDAGQVTAVQGIVRDITELKKAEEADRVNFENNKVLSESAIHLIEISNEDDLLDYVTNQVKILAGDVVVVTTSVDIENGIAHIKSVKGVDNLEKIAKLFNKNSKNMYFESPKNSNLEYRTPSLQEFKGGIYELALRRIPKQICDLINNWLNIDKIYLMAFMVKKEFLGDIIIITRRGSELKNKEVITALVNQSSIALQKKILEEDMKKSEDKYRNLTENINDIIYSMDDKGVITYISPKVASYGINPMQLIGKNFSHIIYRDDLHNISNDVTTTLKTGKEFISIFRVQNDKGELFWFEDKGKARTDDSGKVVGILGIIRDITERRKAEENLRNSEEEFRTIFDSSTDGIIVVDLNGKILKINKKILELTGYDESDFIGKLFTSLSMISINDLPNLSVTFAGYMSSFTKLNELAEFEINTRKGEKLIIELKASPFIKNGRKTGIILIIRDITERNKLGKLESDAKVNEELNKMRNDFLMMITHELKQPLTPIIGYAGLLKNEELSRVSRDYVDKIISSSYKMKDLVNSILTLIKLEAGTLEFHFEKYDLSQIIVDSLAEKTSLISLKRIIISKELDKVDAVCDYERIKDTVNNLIENAVKFSKPNSEIYLRLWKDNNNAYIIVKDHGVGIRKDDIPKLFTKFYQTEEGRKEGGTGIGLAIVKMIIDKHHGNVRVSSEYGKGSEFIISLPLKGADYGK
ncbi:Methanogenesis regulatory histidine kinase FilI [Candidatus Tiddalikarchaeum anstoanum]|nr:Methanogenesis regulatory histidine kinase FilI [Candidatus Tiddalikarchaeum anstoanum]